MVVTRYWLTKHKTPNGGYTKEQLAAVGVSWPPQQGWIKRILGNEVTPEQQRIFEGIR